MDFVPEDRRRGGVWRSLPQGTAGAVELRLLYLEFELERRLLAHEWALRRSLWGLRAPLDALAHPLYPRAVGVER